MEQRRMLAPFPPAYMEVGLPQRPAQRASMPRTGRQGRSPAAAAAAPGRVRISLGIDTASVARNHNPDWVRARTQVPIDFAIIRSNYGTDQDTVFRRDWPRLKAAGLVRGAYLFLRFPHSRRGRPASPVAQARAFIATVGNLDQSDLPPSLDVEFPGGRRRPG